MSRATTNDPWMAAYDTLVGGDAQADPWMAEYDKLAGGVQPSRTTNAARMAEAMAQPATGTAIPTYTQNTNNPLSRPVPGGQVGQFATGAASELLGLPATGARAAQAGVQFLANRAPAGSQWGTLAQDAAAGLGRYAGGLEAVTDVAASGVGLPQTTGGVAETLGRGAAQLGLSVVSGSGPASALGRAGAFAATSAAPVVGSTMRDATAETGNAGKAADEAVVNGVITGATSVIPGIAILNRVPGGGQLVKAAAQRTISRLGGAGLAEASQEYAEGVLDELTAELIRRDKSLTPSMVWRAMTNPDRAMDVLGGAVLGSAARGGVEVAGRIGGANGVQDAHAVPPAPNAAPDQGAGVAPSAVAPPGVVGPVATDVPGNGGVEPQAAEVGASTFDQALAELRAAEMMQTAQADQVPVQSTEDAAPLRAEAPAPDDLVPVSTSSQDLQVFDVVPSDPPTEARPESESEVQRVSSPNPTQQLQSSMRLLSDLAVATGRSPEWAFTGEEPVSVLDAPQPTKGATNEKGQEVRQEVLNTPGAADAAPDVSAMTPAQIRAEARRLGVSPAGPIAKVRGRVRAAKVDTAQVPPLATRPASQAIPVGSAESASTDLDTSLPKPSPTVPPAGRGPKAGDNLYLLGDDGEWHAVQVNQVRKMFGATKVKLLGGTKWMAIDDERLSTTKKSGHPPASRPTAESPKVNNTPTQAKPQQQVEQVVYDGWNVPVQQTVDAELARLSNLSRAQRSEIEAEVRGFHARNVRAAVATGKPVPASVLADYPDLAPKVTGGAASPDTTPATGRTSAPRKPAAPRRKTAAPAAQADTPRPASPGVEKGSTSGEGSRPTAEQLIARSTNIRDGLRALVESHDKPAIWLDHQFITEDGKYEVVDGRLTKVQPLNSNGFMRNLRDIGYGEEKGWAGANKAAKEMLEKDQRARQAASDIEAERSRQNSERIAKEQAENSAYQQGIHDALASTKFKKQDVAISIPGGTSKTVPMSVANGLGIHKDIEGARGYVVTHVGSGKRIAIIDSLGKAKAFVVAASKRIDFTQGEATLVKQMTNEKYAELRDMMRSPFDKPFDHTPPPDAKPKPKASNPRRRGAALDNTDYMVVTVDKNQRGVITNFGSDRDAAAKFNAENRTNVERSGLITNGNTIEALQQLDKWAAIERFAKDGPDGPELSWADWAATKQQSDSRIEAKRKPSKEDREFERAWKKSDVRRRGAALTPSAFSKPNQTDTPQFKEWFGNSKVVDANGKPLVVYHGTPNSGFEEFRGRSYFGSLETANKFARGTYGDDTPGVYPVYLSLQNPMKTSDPAMRTSAGLKMAERLGYDGVIFTSKTDPEDVYYVAFKPEQIKSATGNSGAFGRHNPRISGHAINPIEEIADRLRTAQRQGRKSAAGPARDVAKIEARAARQSARALRRAESSAAKLSEQLGESQDVKRAYRDVLRESRRDLAVAREDIVKLGDKLRAAKDKAAVAEEARAIVGRVANALPLRLRGALMTDVRDAKGVADVYVAVQKARDAVAKEIGRDAQKVLDRYTSRKVKGRLSDAAREKLADIERRAAEAVRQFNAPLASAGDAAIELADLADQAKAVVHEHRLENKLIREGRFWDAELDRQKVVENLAAKKPLPLKADGKGREQPGIIANLFRGNMNAWSIAKTLDGFKDGPATQLMREIQAGQFRRFELTEAATMQADAAANRAGFDNLSHLMAATSDLLGEGPTIRKDVTLGGRKFTLTLGELAKLYSTEQDVNTRALIAAGKPIQFRTGGKFSDPIRLTPADFATVAEALPQEIKAAVNSMKVTRDRMFPAVQKVIRTLKGYEPPKEAGYEPRYVNREQSGATTDAELTPDLSGQIEKHLENAGFTIERVKDKTNPLIIGDFFHDWSRSVNGQADVIALAVPIANARKVLLAPATKQAIADRYGDVATKRLREILVDAAGLRADPGSVTAAVQRLTRNVSYARTALRPTSWLIQGAGVPRIAAEMPARAFADGLRGAFSPSLGRRMMDGSPMLRKRYSGTLASVNTSLGDPSTAITPHGDETIRDALGTAARAGKAVVTDAAKGDVGGVVNKALPELFDTVRISNFFDSIPARIAWAGFEAEARRTGKDQAWVRQQAEDALSRVLNSSDPLHLTAYGSKFRNTPLVPFTAFTSDAAAAWNQVYQGWGESRTKGMNATAAVVAGSLWAAAITGTSGYLGKMLLEEKDEEDARKEALRQAATRFLQETVGMGFIEGKLSDLIDASAKGFDVNVADAPMIGAVNQTIRATHGLSTAIYDRLASEDPAKVESASQRFVDALARIVENAGALAGNPLTPAVGAGRKAIKSEMEETGKELREKKQDATGDEGTSPEEALGRRQLYDAMASGGDTAKAFATLRAAGVRMNRKQIQALVEAKHPARGMKPIERVRYLKSLSPDARKEYDRQLERYRQAVKSIPRAARASRAGSSAQPR